MHIKLSKTMWLNVGLSNNWIKLSDLHKDELELMDKITNVDPIVSKKVSLKEILSALNTCMVIANALIRWCESFREEMERQDHADLLEFQKNYTQLIGSFNASNEAFVNFNKNKIEGLSPSHIEIGKQLCVDAQSCIFSINNIAKKNLSKEDYGVFNLDTKEKTSRPLARAQRTLDSVLF